MTYKTERIRQLELQCRKRGMNPPENHYMADLHKAALEDYESLPKWEKIARATHDALVNQELYIAPDDRIIGQVFFEKNQPVAKYDRDFDCETKPRERTHREIEHYDEMWQHQFFTEGAGRGHISWRWDRILRYGVSGLKDMYTKSLEKARDEKAREFYTGVLIELDAIIEWNQKHTERLRELHMTEMAAICERVPEYPARTFHEAVQAFYMQYLMVLSENPYGGNSPGRLDYYLWPYLEQDLKEGRCTLQEARELVDELFLRFDESVHNMDGWGITISIGGCHEDGSSAVSPLTELMIESIMDMNITHPLVYPRVPPQGASPEYLRLCARYLLHGHNRAQILNDAAIIRAMENSGVTKEDATDYVCGGCMEVSPQGRNSDFLFNGWHNIAKLVELAITGGQCLISGEQLQSVTYKGLTAYADFEEFYRDFEEELTRILHIFYQVQDYYSEEAATSRPAYLLSGMLDDCMERGRNMHDGGVRYHNYGSAPIGLPNAADALFAVKKAVYDEKLCTAEELVQAMKTDYAGKEYLRRQLQNLPKYGQQDPEADQMAARVMSSVCRAYASYRNRLGGTALPMVLTFVFGPQAAAMLGAGADGSHAGKMVAHGLTPQSSSMTKGLTAAMGSNLCMPMELFTGGASTMWDFDPAWINEELLQAILETFLEGGGQIFQGNTTDVQELIRAQKNPEEYGHVIVRVGGYSARFVSLDKDLQNDIITRYRHVR